MSICTAAEAVEDFLWWEGYCEKATAKYATRRDKSVFELDKGSNNFTYPGYHCGVQGGAWCAMMVSTAVDEACGGKLADTKKVLHGLWPYTSCDQLYDAAPTAYRGRRGNWDPQPGDVIVFSSNGYTREHTGMVIAADKLYVYTIEGNSSDMCRRRSYLKTSSWIYGYVRPLYAAGAAPAVAAELYGPLCLPDTGLHVLSKGVAGPEVATVQRILYARGIMGADGKRLTVDGDFGANTKAAVITAQKWLGLAADGVVGRETWTGLLTGFAA